MTRSQHTGPRRVGRRVLLGAAAAATVRGPAVRAVERRHVRIAWRPGIASGVAVLVAVQKGLFAQFGLEAELVGVPAGSGLAEMLRDGRTDAAIGFAVALLAPLHDGLDARIAAGVGGGGLRLLAEKRSGLRHIEDMKGRTIGVGRLDGAAKLFFSIMMRRKGIDPFREVSWVELAAGAQGDALRAGTVDALAVPDAQGFFLREQLALVEIATNLSGSYRDRTATVLVCAGGLLRADPAACASLVHGLGQAAEWVTRHPPDAAAVAAPLAPLLDDAERDRMLREEAPGEHPTGKALRDDIAAYADELRLVGLLPYEMNASAFARHVCVDI